MSTPAERTPSSERAAGAAPAAKPGSGASEAEPLLRLERDARGVVTLTLNRPLAYNALSEALLAALQRELDTLEAQERLGFAGAAAGLRSGRSAGGSLG